MSAAQPIAISQTCQYYYVMRSSPDGGNSFSDPQLLVLASLAERPKHGHAMLDDIERIVGTRLGPGTLYGAISRLEAQGWIEPMPQEDRRKPYRMTEAGRSAFVSKISTLERIVACADSRLASAR